MRNSLLKKRFGKKTPGYFLKEIEKAKIREDSISIPRLIAKFEKAVLEEKVSNPMKRLNHLREMKKLERELETLQKIRDPLMRVRVLEAGAEMNLEGIVRNAAKDPDYTIRIQAGKIAVKKAAEGRKEMKKVVRLIMENPKEEFKVKQEVDNEIRAIEGKKPLGRSYEKTVAGKDRQLSRVVMQIKKEKKAMEEREKEGKWKDKKG